MDYLVYLIGFLICFASLCRRDLVLAMAVFAALLPCYIVRFSIGPLPSTALEGMALILIASYAWHYRHKPQLGRFFYAGLALTLAALLASILSPEMRAAFGIWRAYFLEPLLLYIVAINVLRTPADWNKLYRGLGCAVFGLTLIAIYQYATGQFLPTWEWTTWATRRATGVYTSPNSLGLFVVPIVLWALGQRRDRFDIAVVSAGTVCVLLAWSKGALLALCIGALILFWGQVSKRLVIILTALFASLIIFIPGIRQATIDLATLQTPSGQSRLALYRGSWELIKQHPLAGTGLAHFGTAFESVRPETFTEKLIYPHNIFLNFWLETGLLGLIALLSLIACIIRVVWMQRHNPEVLALGVALLAMLIHGLVDVPYFKNDLAMLTWLLLAALSTSTTTKPA